MTSRQYAKMMEDHLKHVLAEHNITEYCGVGLSADRTEYEVTLLDGTTVIIPSGMSSVDD